jgi:hypothetical protein
MVLAPAGGSRADVQLQLVRQGGSGTAGHTTGGANAAVSGPPPAVRTTARLLVGSCADDRLLFSQTLVLETFDSPHTVRNVFHS